MPWTADDLYAISRRGSREIEIGLVQLERAGLVDKRPSGRYHTPTTISDFAFDRLEEIGGQQLIDATTILQASDILRKAELVLRYVRQAMLKEFWQDEDKRQALMESMSKQFSGVSMTVKKQSRRNQYVGRATRPIARFL